MEKPSKKPETCIWAIISIICAFQFPLLGIVFAIVALEELKKKPYMEGKSLATAALIISIVYVVIGLVIVFAMIIFFGILFSQLAPSTLP